MAVTQDSALRPVIAPSLLAADFMNLERELRDLARAEIARLHLDVMDGHFVPNLSFGPSLIRQARQVSELFFETHLMMSHPRKYITEFAQAGSDMILIHAECKDSLQETLNDIRNQGVQAGLVLKPQTPIDLLLPHLDCVDQVLLMSVEPGFGGQNFLDDTYARIAEVRERRGHHRFAIAVDGGITPENAGKCLSLGAQILVAGTSFFKASCYHQAHKDLLAS